MPRPKLVELDLAPRCSPFGGAARRAKPGWAEGDWNRPRLSPDAASERLKSPSVEAGCAGPTAPPKGEHPKSSAPAPLPQLEEIAAAAPGDVAAALGFSLFRLSARPDPRPLMLILTPRWMREHGRPCARGLRLSPSRLLLVVPEREAQALWALEEALKSGAVSGALAGADSVPFVVTRRLEFAARAGGAMGLVLRDKPSPELSAARLRWRVSTLPSAKGELDPAAPGLPRWRAELTRRRDGPPATFIAEREDGDETHRLRLAAGLAGDGLAEAGRAHAAA